MSDAPAKTPWLLCAAAGLLMFAAFEPLGWGPLAWPSLVPLCLLARCETLPRRTYLAAYAGGLLWSVPSVAWMRLADPAMAFGWAALSAYMAAYFPLFVALCRVGRDFAPRPLVAAVVWMGLELVRCRLMTGFPWYLLGHSQHEWATLCQVADLGGAALISGLIAGFAGVAAEAPRPAAFDRLRLPRPADAADRFTGSAVAYGVVLAAAVGYGFLRLSQADFTAGPRVALVQGNFTSRMKQDRNMAPLMWRTHARLTEIATPEQPDLVVWPETMYPYPLLELPEGVPADWSRQVLGGTPEEVRGEDAARRERLSGLALRSGAAAVIGVIRSVADPADPAAPFRDFNSAVYVRPDGTFGDAYGKVHRVPFGEYMPLSDWIPLLRRFSFVGPGLAAGEAVAAFEHPEATLIPNICFEDTVPELTAEAVREAPAGGERGLIVNLTNDGWFHGSAELDQHLITASFRCIETRTPMARAVNTGVSAFIDGNGTVLEPEVMLNADAAVPSLDRPRGDGEPVPTTMRDESGDYRRQFHGVLVTDVPLDPRGSVYLVIGDLIPALAAAVCLVLAVVGWVRRRKSKSAESPA